MSETPDRDREHEHSEAPEDQPEEPGAEGGSTSSSADKLPGEPAPGDDTPVGDTDQHSDA